MQARHVARLHSHGFPVVLIDDQYIPPGVPWIHADNFTGAYSAAQHLIALGHRRIAHIQGPAGYLCSRERYQGYSRALQEAGMAVDPALIVSGDFTEISGQAAARALFALSPEQRPTAIFAASDQMAFGVLAVAEEYGLTVPGDVALVGFDDIGLSSLVRPALTTIRQPFPEMGQCAIELLLSRLDSHRFPSGNRHLEAPSDDKHQEFRIALPVESSLNGEAWLSNENHESPALSSTHIQLATSLVVRASCGASRVASKSAARGTAWGAVPPASREEPHDVSFSTPGLSP